MAITRPPGGAAAGTHAISGGGPASIRLPEPRAGPVLQRPSSIGGRTRWPAWVQLVSEQRTVPATGLAARMADGGWRTAGGVGSALPEKAPSTAAIPTPSAASARAPASASAADRRGGGRRGGGGGPRGRGPPSPRRGAGPGPRGGGGRGGGAGPPPPPPA